MPVPAERAVPNRSRTGGTSIAREDAPVEVGERDPVARDEVDVPESSVDHGWTPR
jgi:hypothetical protein